MRRLSYFHPVSPPERVVGACLSANDQSPRSYWLPESAVFGYCFFIFLGEDLNALPLHSALNPREIGDWRAFFSLPLLCSGKCQGVKFLCWPFPKDGRPWAGSCGVGAFSRNLIMCRRWWPWVFRAINTCGRTKRLTFKCISEREWGAGRASQKVC